MPMYNFKKITVVPTAKVRIIIVIVKCLEVDNASFFLIILGHDQYHAFENSKENADSNSQTLQNI